MRNMSRVSASIHVLIDDRIHLRIDRSKLQRAARVGVEQSSANCSWISDATMIESDQYHVALAAFGET
jgi:hypothetical protein